MIITYHGKQFFKIQAGDTVLACNPISKDSKEKPSSKFGADVVFVTTNHPDFNGVETVTYGDKEPFVVDGPGSYEVKGIFVKGVMVKTEIDKQEYINSIYAFDFDNIRVCFLGHISSGELSSDARDAIGDVDIVFVPLEDGGAMKPDATYKFARSFDPKVIIPMDYGKDTNSSTLKTFLKESGDEKLKPEQKFTVKKNDLAGRDADIILLSA